MVLAGEHPPIKLVTVVPCYRVCDAVLTVLSDMPDVVSAIVCVDDGCPDQSGRLIEEHSTDPRVQVVYHEQNNGVGAAMVTGYRKALELKADIVIKIDGDGQMSPDLIPRLIAPIIAGSADYTKGNRFYSLAHLKGMPTSRLLGNASLSFMSKLSTGYWRIFDPTNGFTAIHASVLALLPMEQLHPRYCFESDMLYQLSTLRAVVQDVPQRAIYGDETSHLNILKNIPTFLWLHTRNFYRRIFYNYFLRDFHLASVQWLLGPCLLLFGFLFGGFTWISNVADQVETPIGTVVLAALSIITGLQLLLSALGFDIDNQPRDALWPQLEQWAVIDDSVSNQAPVVSLIHSNPKDADQ